MKDPAGDQSEAAHLLKLNELLSRPLPNQRHDYFLHKDRPARAPLRAIGRIHTGQDEARNEEVRGLRRTASALVMAVGTLVAANFLYTPPPEPFTHQDLVEYCHQHAVEQAKMAGIADSALVVASLARHCELTGGI